MSVITRAASKDSEMKAAEPEPSTKLPAARKQKAAANQKKASLPIDVPSLNVEKVLEVIDFKFHWQFTKLGGYLGRSCNVSKHVSSDGPISIFHSGITAREVKIFVIIVFLLFIPLVVVLFLFIAIINIGAVSHISSRRWQIYFTS